MHARARARTHARTHACAHVRTHARAHARTRSRTRSRTYAHALPHRGKKPNGQRTQHPVYVCARTQTLVTRRACLLKPRTSVYQQRTTQRVRNIELIRITMTSPPVRRRKLFSHIIKDWLSEVDKLAQGMVLSPPMLAVSEAKVCFNPESSNLLNSALPSAHVNLWPTRRFQSSRKRTFDVSTI
eukprot:6186520-Pleurochrysis_carterae.AAC.8